MAKMTDDGQRAQVARKTTLVSVVVNLFYPALRFWRAFSGSQGLIADGIHSLSDLVADFVVLLANKKAANPRIAITTTGTGAMKTALHW
jgi:divalent metal cation (Fe/Co/Zn/Cd) transporter